jgi:hypothetical protein
MISPIRGDFTGFRVQVPPRTHMQLSDLRLCYSPESCEACFCRSGPWGFKSDSGCGTVTAIVNRTRLTDLRDLHRPEVASPPSGSARPLRMSAQVMGSPFDSADGDRRPEPPWTSLTQKRSLVRSSVSRDCVPRHFEIRPVAGTVSGASPRWYRHGTGSSTLWPT